METTTTITKRNWGMFAAGPVVAIIGAILLFFPGITLLSATIVFGILLCAVGIVDLIFYAINRDEIAAGGWAIALGIVDIVLGILFLINPVISALVRPTLAGIYFLAYGVFQLLSAYQLRGTVGNGWLVFSGVVAIICGFLFFIMPVMFGFFVALYLFIRGCAMIGGGLTPMKITVSESTNTTTFSNTQHAQNM